MDKNNSSVRAVRTIRLCTKDCLCLYVCPTGASDTENGQIDASKCIGCGKCADACPSHAISMVPYEYPPQQQKVQSVTESMRRVAKVKTEHEIMANQIRKNATTSCAEQLATAIAKSNRIMAEDILRESGFMLPQSTNTHNFLTSLLDGYDAKSDKDFPREEIEKLLLKLPVND